MTPLTPLPDTADAIRALIPHQGRMALLDRVLECSPTRIVCSTRRHAAADHPLRSASGLLSAVGIEYAAQAAALHGALNARPGVQGRPGFLASARGVRLHVPRLDTEPGDLQVEATHAAGDERQALFQFVLRGERGRALVEGRLTVVLDTELAA